MQETRDYVLEGEERKNPSHMGCMAGNMATKVLLAVGGKKIEREEDHLAGSTGCCLEDKSHRQILTL